MSLRGGVTQKSWRRDRENRNDINTVLMNKILKIEVKDIEIMTLVWKIDGDYHLILNKPDQERLIQ